MKLKMYIAEVGAGLFLAIFATWFLLKGLKLPSVVGGVGPRTFPVGIASIMLVLAVLLIAHGIKNKSDKEVKINRSMNLLGYVIMLFFYISFMDFLGYYLASIIMLPILLILTGERNWKIILPVSIGFIVFALVIFDLFLGVLLP